MSNEEWLLHRIKLLKENAIEGMHPDNMTCGESKGYLQNIVYWADQALNDERFKK